MLSGRKRRHEGGHAAESKDGEDDEDDGAAGDDELGGDGLGEGDRDGGAADEDQRPASAPAEHGRVSPAGAAGATQTLEAGGGNPVGFGPKGPGGATGEAKEGEGEEEASGLELDLDLAKLPGMSPLEMQELLDKFTPEQMSRYEAYRRSALRQAVVKKMVSSVAGTNVSQNVIIVLAGVAKLFVGEMVETARAVMGERGDDGPIRPAHLREAHRRLRASNRIPQRSRNPILR